MKKIPVILLACGLIITGLIIASPSEDKGGYKEDIQRAKQYSENQDVCTDEFKELVSPDVEKTYGASDGCEITFLEERGWRAASQKKTEQRVVETCIEDKDCGWVSTNCCSENMGAHWECLNEKETKIDCPEDVVCPAVVSPKPDVACRCVEGICQKTAQ